MNVQICSKLVLVCSSVFVLWSAQCEDCLSPAAEFVEEPQDLLIPVGSPAVFHCSIAATTAVSLQWAHNGQPLPPTQFFSNGTLALQTTEAGDEGTYQCVYTELNSGQVLERSATLTFACEHSHLRVMHASTLVECSVLFYRHHTHHCTWSREPVCVRGRKCPLPLLAQRQPPGR